MKNIITLAVSLFSLTIFAQVGINNNTPKATLDITAQTTNGSKPEGLLPPRLTGDQIQAGDAQYTAAQAGIIIYATAAATAPSTKTANITSAGYYFYDGSAWQKLTSGASAADATTTAKGIVQLAGDLSGTAASPAIAADAVTSAKILDGTVANADLATGTGGIYKGSGSLSGNTTVTQGANILAFTSTATNGFSVDGTTLSVDAANDRVGIGTNVPSTNLEINSGTLNDSGLKLTQLTAASSATSGNVAGIGVDNNGKIVVVGGSTQVNRYTFSSSAAQGTNPSFVPNITSQTINLISGSSRTGNIITLPQGTYEVAFTFSGSFTGASIANYFDGRLYVNSSLYQIFASYSSSGTNGGTVSGTAVFTLNSTGTIYVGGYIQVGAGVWNFDQSNTFFVIKKLL